MELSRKRTCRASNALTQLRSRVVRERPEANLVANPTPPPRKRLGDHVETALTAVGITAERVTRWVGRPCRCKERKERLNLLHAWVEKKARGLFRGNREAAKELEELLE